ncbi:hypothetical protein CRG98_000039 [Punica granatum]|uniref:Uncharacterized protein n=1 Tax=Punica granatum TaxID=22663 RepID=A0A2I0LFW4_PUNGR|nr:hypothetical protein CRG98_000039 [Punica granatum]
MPVRSLRLLTGGKSCPVNCPALDPPGRWATHMKLAKPTNLARMGGTPFSRWSEKFGPAVTKMAFHFRPIFTAIDTREALETLLMESAVVAH